ncbi:SDR family NAD(P)-dependent oxidoreductase, partial [Aquimarina muelleri]
MKLQLKKIYQDVSSGKLTQKEALEKIKVIKQQEQDTTTTEALLCNQVWETTSLEIATENSLEYVQRHIILCEMPQIKEEEVKISFPDSEVLVLQADPQQNIANRYSSYALICFDYLRTLLTNKVQGKILVQIVTGNSTEQAVFTGLSGLLKTAGLENPKLVGQVIITHPEVEANTLFLQLEESQTMFLDSVIKYEQDIRYVLRNKEIPATHSDPKIAFKDQGVYLITGGMGGLGLLFAKEILKQTTHSRIILTGRSILTPEKKAVLDALPVRNSSVEYHSLDLNNLDQVSTLISSISDGGKQITGILHCAGMTSDNFIIKKTSDEFEKVLTPKVSGTFNLDIASKDLDLDFMVLFSSVASLFGNVGQSDYAVANGFMDWFSVYRNGLVSSGDRQGHTVSINWPLWQEGGMQIDQKNQEALRKTFGMHPMPTTTGMYAFYRSLELRQSQVLIMEGDVVQMRQSLLEDQKIQKQRIPTPFNEEQKIALNGSSESYEEKIEEYLCKQFATVLRLTSHKIDPQEPLEKYGIDSIMAMSLTDQLEKTFGSLPKTLFFEYQTIRELSEYFIKSHASQLSKLFTNKENSQQKIIEERSEPPIRNINKKGLIRKRKVVTSKNTINSTETDPIAIVGLSGRYPDSVNIEAYWDNLRAGKDCITEVPKERWDWREYYSEDRTKSGHHYSKWGGFIEGVDEFDPRFFNISPREAKSIDPQERLFLQHSWMAVE